MKENNIEKDIELLQNATNSLGLFLKCKGSEKYKTAIDHIISDYKRVLKENEELKDLIIHKNEYTKKLEEDLFENCSNYVISKSKIKDKIEELNQKIKYEENEKAIIYLHKQRKILQELIKEREEK